MDRGLGSSKGSDSGSDDFAPICQRMRTNASSITRGDIGMPLESRISPNFSDEKYRTESLDDLIDVFEDRLKYWLLVPAKASSLAGLAALSLLLGYFEPHAIYRKGEDSKGQSKAFFRAGFAEVFRKALSRNLFALASLTCSTKMPGADSSTKECCASAS
jgi:hypothetical protein